MWQPFCEHQDY